ncbi:Carotenoid cleavage dioxygenase 8 B [Chlorella vulgaris]
MMLGAVCTTSCKPIGAPLSGQTARHLPPAPRQSRSRTTHCSAASETASAPSTSGDSKPPLSWPSTAAREAAYSATSRQAVEDVPATVTGHLPTWLNGLYIRNGPGDLQPMDHMFDGYGMLSSFKLDGRNNSATGSHRFIDSAAWQHYAATGKMRWREFATAPRYESLGDRLSDVASTLGGVLGLAQGVTDNASVNIVPLPDGTAVALTETVQGTYRVDPDTLQTLGQVQYSKSGVKGDLTTAHPALLANGDLINLVSAVGVGFNVYRHPAGAFEQRQLIATVPHRRPLAPAWVHDFPATQTYAVVPEMPLYFNVGKLLLGGTSDYIFMDWAPSDGTTLHVVDLRDGRRRSYRAPACFVFHWGNAFESPDGRYLHLDACLYEDPEIVNDLYLRHLRAEYQPGRQAGRAFLRRATIDLQAPDGSEVSWRPLVEDEAELSPPFDFPKVNPLYRGKPYRYLYGACSTRPTNAHNSVAKFDVEQGSLEVWHEAGTLVGEPVFVPAPEATAEDDGVVMVVLVQADGSSALVVLDGKSLEEVARCRVAAVASRPRLLVPAHASSRSPVRVAAAPGGPVTTSSTEAEEVGAGAGAVFTGADGHASTIVPFRTTTTEPKTEPAAPVPDAKEPASWPSAAARRGLYSDVAVDRVDSLHAKVLGKLPAWLRGSFYRNGPGMFGGAHAVFDGCALLVRFRLHGPDNEVVLSHRFLESVYYRAAKEQGSIKWKMAHPPAEKSTLKGLAYASGIETLETLSRVTYRDDIHGMVKSAHPHRLPNGDLVGMAADFSPFLDRDSTPSRLRLPEITVYRQSPWQSDRRLKVASVPVSERYAVVVQNPIYYNVRAMMMGQTSDFMVFEWKPECGSLIHVVPLLGGKTKTYHAPPFLATHWVNAFESSDGRYLHLDACCTDTPALLTHFDLNTVRAGADGGKEIEDSVLRRLTIDLSLEDGSFLDQQPLLQQLVPDEQHGNSFELPSINPRNAGLPYRFTYGTSCVRPSNCWNALTKLDTVTGEVKMWHEAGGAAWEPIFVPRPGAKAEDDGCVLSTIMQSDGRSALLVLDARTWREVARAVLPYALPNGFHGCFVPS